MSTQYVIGIDFGTSNSCITYATYEESNGRLEPEPIHRPEPITFQHHDTIPTVILQGEEGQGPLFGELAEEKSVFFPELTRAGFKMRLGQPGPAGAEAFELARQFLGYLRSRVAEHVPLDAADENFRIRTVVGHPVQWSADQREETQRAAQEAGFPNVELEEESLACLFAHLCEDRNGFQPPLGSHVLMIDMGGGTCDFAFLQLPDDPSQRPVSTPVDPATILPAWREGAGGYGGRDLDALLLEHLSRDWDPDWVRRQRAFLLREVRRFKEGFSAHVREGIDRHETIFLVGDRPCRVALTCDEFESVACDYVAHFEKLVRGALELARLAPGQVSALILAGGHSRWFWVDETLRRIFPHISREKFTLLRHSHPEQSVARGLAYVPMVRAAGARILAPVRKSVHSLWVHVPHGTRTGVGVPDPAVARLKEGRNGYDEAVLILPRGHQLPFRTPKPIRIMVNKLDLDNKEASVRIQFYSSAGGGTRVPLHERVARFERNFWENVMKRFGGRLPWAKGVDEDQFELLIMCDVDESELLTAELVIVRYFRGKEVDVQRQKLTVQGGIAPGGTAEASSRRSAPAGYSCSSAGGVSFA
jgi:hypothetical protein